MSNKVINTILIFVLLAAITTSTITRTNTVDVFSYISIISLIAFAILNLRWSKLTNKWYVLILVPSLILHYLFTTDKITTVIILIFTVLFFEALKNTVISLKAIVVAFIILFFVGFIASAPDLMQALLMHHTSREDLYLGIFKNGNTNALYTITTLSVVVLFLKRGMIKNILIVMGLLAIVASGSRNAMLSVILTGVFYYIQKTKFKKRLFLSFVGMLLVALIYLLFFEMNTTVDFTIMGKEANSAGRATQIALVIEYFPINLFGNGKDAVQAFSFGETDFAVHNFYVYSLYSLGAIALLCYIFFVYDLQKRIKSELAKAILLAFNVYYFFEPGLCYYVSYSAIPIMVILFYYSNVERKPCESIAFKPQLANREGFSNSAYFSKSL